MTMGLVGWVGSIRSHANGASSVADAPISRINAAKAVRLSTGKYCQKTE